MKRAVGFTFLTVTLLGCGTASPVEQYSLDCTRIEEELTQVTGELQAQVLAFGPDERLVDRVVVEDGELRRFEGVPPPVIDEWRAAGARALDANLILLFGEMWPLTAQADLREVLRELSRNELRVANESALRAMCPGLSERIDAAYAAISDSVDQKARNLEIPFGDQSVE